MNTIADYQKMVSHPGKFEGEKAYVPYFWDCFLNGEADDFQEDSIFFTIVPQDRAIFPELENRAIIELIETNDGFVCEVI